MSNTWTETVEGYEAAIAQLKKITPDRPLYSKMQDYILKWSADISYVRLLETAQLQAANGSVEGLSTAINQARQVPSDSTQWQEAQKAIGEWSNNLNSQQDQPILNRADELSAAGDPASLKAAIQQARQISAGSPLYADAQQRIHDWRIQLGINPNPPAAFSAQPKPIAKAATEAESSTPTDQASDNLLQEAKDQQVMNDWGNEMLALAARQATIDTNEAIAIAQQIPSYCTAYDEAQKQILAWQTSSPRQLPNER
jgi:hypothetical protein